jgi:Eukaryotic porin
MTYTSTGVQNVKSDALAGDLSLKFSPMAGTTVTSKLFTSGNMTHEAVMERLGVSGLTLTILGGMGSKQVGVGTVEYVTKNAALTSAVDVLSGPIVHAAVTAGLDVATVGVEAEYDTKARNFRRYNFAVNYADSKESEATLTVLNKGETGKLAYSHLARPDLSVAGEFLYDRRADAKLLTMGVKYEVDRETTLKGKINSDGLVSTSYIQEIRPGTTLILSQKLDVRNVDKSTHKLGLSLVIE